LRKGVANVKIVVELDGSESIRLHKCWGATDLVIDDNLVLQMNDKNAYEETRRSLAEVFGLIIPEDASSPEHIAATMKEQPLEAAV
jgi:hypothetical protein